MAIFWVELLATIPSPIFEFFLFMLTQVMRNTLGLAYGIVPSVSCYKK
jgi:hypothetical protein